MSGVGYIGSLAEAQDAIAKGRDKVSRPMKSRAMRLWYTQGDIHVVCYNTLVCKLKPDHIEMLMEVGQLRSLSQTLPQTLPKVFKPPMFVERENNGTYSIRFAGNTTPYFQGMKFRWDTGECTNSPSWANGSEIPEVRRQWLRDMRAYKRKVKSMERLGALGVDTNVGTRWGMDRHREEIISKLVRDIKSNTIDPRLIWLMYEYAKARTYYHRQAVTIADCVDHVFSKHSTELRREYGVFG